MYKRRRRDCSAISNFVICYLNQIILFYIYMIIFAFLLHRRVAFVMFTFLQNFSYLNDVQ